MPSYVIIGDGAAGMAAAQTLRAEAPDATITVLSDEPNPYYYRAALTNYLLGQLRDEQLWGVPAGFYRRHRIGRFFGHVNRVDLQRNTVQIDNGMAIPYDALLVASGAAPLTLDVPGSDLAGVMTFRSLQDVRTIVESLPRLQQTVIVGGGPLGLEWVQALRHHNVGVTFLLREAQIMPRVLDSVASEIVLHQLHAAGVNVVFEDEVAAIEPRQNGAGRAGGLASVGVVRTKLGRQIPCQMVGIAIGVRASTEFLAGSALETGIGLKVNRYLRTNVENIYAAGDVAWVHEPEAGLEVRPGGLWQPARAQGKVAALNMVRGGSAVPYDPGAPFQATHLYDLDFAAAGLTNPLPSDGCEVISARPGPTAYRKLVLRGGRLAGALCVGDRSRALLFKRIIDAQLDVTLIRARLLDPQFDLPGWVRQDSAASGIFSLARPVFRVEPEAPRPTAERVAAGIAARPAPARPGEPERRAPAARSRPAAQLRAGETVYAVQRERPTVLGREPGCDIILPAGFVSRRHAEIVPAGAGYALHDLESANGAWVGLTKLPAGATQPLRDGDSIRLADVYLTFAALAGVGAASQPALALASLRGPSGTVALTQEITSLGRGNTCDVVVPSGQASRLHAQIQRAADGELFLYDMGSTNGARVNGARITDAHQLVDGDVIEIAAVAYTFTRAALLPAAVAAVAELTITAGAGAGTRYALREGAVAIGRAAGGPDDIVLNDPLVSRRHASIVGRGVAFTIQDAGSSSGARVNGVRLQAPRRLAEGDAIEVGQTRLVFHTTPGRQAQPHERTAAPAQAPGNDEPTAIMRMPSARVVRPALVVLGGAEVGRRIALSPGEERVIGRGGPGAEAGAIALADHSASRRHARIAVATDGTATIGDLASRNGTVLNGNALAAPCVLHDGDRILIGETSLRFVADVPAGREGGA